jgi:hypothetical protein
MKDEHTDMSVESSPAATRVFISHSTRDPRDAALGASLARRLRSNGIHVWIAPQDIPAGSEWEAEIISALMEKATHFLAIISAATMRSQWVMKEVRIAEQRRNRDLAFTILPLFIGDVPRFKGDSILRRLQRLPYCQDDSQTFDALFASLNPSLPTKAVEAVASADLPCPQSRTNIMFLPSIAESDYWNPFGSLMIDIEFPKTASKLLSGDLHLLGLHYKEFVAEVTSDLLPIFGLLYGVPQASIRVSKPQMDRYGDALRFGMNLHEPGPPLGFDAQHSLHFEVTESGLSVGVFFKGNGAKITEQDEARMMEVGNALSPYVVSLMRRLLAEESEFIVSPPMVVCGGDHELIFQVARF